MKKSISNSVKRGVIKEYVNNNKSLREVGDMFGIHPETARIILGDKVRPRGTRYLPDGNVKIPYTVKGNNKGRITSATPNANSRWSQSEDEILRDAVSSKMTLKETSELLGRSIPGICCRKTHLIDTGFIKDSEVRFVIPKGVKRVRKSLNSPLPEKNIESEVEVVAVKENVSDQDMDQFTPLTINSTIELEHLAKIVKEFGVNVTMSMTREGTEVKMSK
jgi:transposase